MNHEDEEQSSSIIEIGSAAAGVSNNRPEVNWSRPNRTSIMIIKSAEEANGSPSGVASPMPGDVMHMMHFASVAGPLAKMAEETPAAKISMPGISNIFGNANKVRKLVWTVVVVAAISIATIQVKDRVQYYISTPVTVNVRVTMNESLRFPILTLCNKNVFNESQIHHLRGVMIAEQLPDSERINMLRHHKTGKWNISHLVGYRGMNIKQVWDLLAHDPDKMIIECWFGRNKTCNDVGRWVPVYTYMGVCYSFVRSEPSVYTTGMFNNLYVRLKESENEMYMGESGWKLLIHDHQDSPVIDVRTHGSTLETGWSRDIRLYLREFRTLDTWKRPCVADQNFSKCIEQCFIKAAASRMTCLLPFMDPLLAPELEYCTSADSHWANSVIIEKLFFHGEWTTNNCTHCRRQCQQDIYVTYTETMPMRSSDKSVSKFRIFYQDFTFDEIEESADYGAVSLLCDIGGSLGFLLGFSVLTVFEIVDAVVQTVIKAFDRIASKCGRSKRRNASSPP